MSSKPSMLQPALIGGVALGVASGLPGIGLLNCACCALVLGGAILAVYLYSNNYPPELLPISYGDGAIVGALAGAIGGVVQTIIGLITSLAFAGAGLGTAQLLEALEQANINVPAQVSEWMLASAAGVVGALFALPFHVVIGALFGALGGVLGIAILGGGGSPPAYEPPVTTPTPPPPPEQPIATGGPSREPEARPEPEPEPEADAGPDEERKE